MARLSWLAPRWFPTCKQPTLFLVFGNKVIKKQKQHFTSPQSLQQDAVKMSPLCAVAVRRHGNTAAAAAQQPNSTHQLVNNYNNNYNNNNNNNTSHTLHNTMLKQTDLC